MAAEGTYIAFEDIQRRWRIDPGSVEAQKPVLGVALALLDTYGDEIDRLRTINHALGNDLADLDARLDKERSSLILDREAKLTAVGARIEDLEAALSLIRDECRGKVEGRLRDIRRIVAHVGLVEPEPTNHNIGG